MSLEEVANSEIEPGKAAELKLKARRTPTPLCSSFLRTDTTRLAECMSGIYESAIALLAGAGARACLLQYSTAIGLLI